MKSFLGEYVVTGKHGHKGRVIRIFHSIGETNVDESWIKGQRVPITEEELKGHWYSILCKDGGSVLVSEIDIIRKEKPYKLNNVWENEFFADKDMK